MKSLVLSLILVSTSAFASVNENIKCLSQFRSVMKAHKELVRSTDKVAADSMDSANFIVASGNELIVQSDRRVGSYGYHLKSEGQKAQRIARNLHDSAKANEVVVEEGFLALENCILGIEEETEVQPEQI